MTKSNRLYGKLSIIFVGICIGLGATYLLDKYREQQTSAYVERVFVSMKDTTSQAREWKGNEHLKRFGNKNIKTINSLGQLENYSITSTDASYNFNNELGLHTVALVRTNAKYKEGDLEIIFNLFKNNGKWFINKVYINKNNV